MTKGSEISGSSAPKLMTGYAYVGPISTVPAKTTVGEGSYENKTQVSFGDKQTGSYGRATTVEKASAGDFQWQNGKSGTRSEYKESSTVRIGDKSGYTEVYNEQSVRNVHFNSSGSKNITTYDNRDGAKYDGDACSYYRHAYGGDGGSYGGNGYEYEYEHGYDSDY